MAHATPGNSSHHPHPHHTPDIDPDRHTPPDRNPDPITDAPGSHPVGTGIGAASGAATGAAVGAIGGPAGAVIGGVSGAVVGGLIGHGIGEAVDPTEDEYWRDTYRERPYHRDIYTYDDYEPAYRLGYNAAAVNRHETEGVRPYDDDIDAQLRDHYERSYRGTSRLDWADAQHAVRDAYDRRTEASRTATTASGR